MLKRAFIAPLIAVICLGQQPAAPDRFAGSFEKRTYHNPFFGLSIEVRKGWTNSPIPEVRTGTMVQQKGREAATARIRQRQKEQNVIFAAGQAQVWVNLSELSAVRTDSGTGSAQMAFVLPYVDQMEIRAIPFGGLEPTAARQKRIDELRSTAKGFAAAVDPVVIDRVAFVRLDYQTVSGKEKLFHTAFLALRNGYILNFSIGSLHEKQLEKLVPKLMDTVRFESAPAGH
jgi:hypothetical protein